MTNLTLNAAAQRITAGTSRKVANVQVLLGQKCRAGRIPGAVKEYNGLYIPTGYIWLIPEAWVNEYIKNPPRRGPKNKQEK